MEKLIFKGKTKDVYELPNGNYLLKFKDDATGQDGVFDPGSNSVGLTIEGMGLGGLKMSEYFFRIINDAGYLTHFVSANINKAEMTVRPAEKIGAGAEKIGAGIEVICRYRAVGSFLRRYGALITPGAPLDALIEITIKDDERGDPPISRDTLIMLNMLTVEEYDTVIKMTKGVAKLVKDELDKKGLELYDIKFEFARIDGKIALIDDFSAGIMRVYKDGQLLGPIELANAVL